ncbi:MAG: glycosyltransferase [Bacteroidetes bacterium]|nr:glycosyltransferase [Bacteroidota bacterium]
MSKKTIHIVSFDIPYPADYGGVQDVFSRLKWFSQNGYNVHLHCFEYNRNKAPELTEYATVHYYNRPRGFIFLFSTWPFIVKTRIHQDLIEKLEKTSDLVILEGLHCAWYTTLQFKKFWVRTHNIEHEYYEQLANQSSGFKKIYYNWESRKLKRFEKILHQAKGILAITPYDQHYFSSLNANCIWLPPVFEKGSKFVETRPYILYHGNLSVEENIKAAHWLLDEIIPHVTNIPFIIAGKNPPKEIIEKAQKLKVQLIVNPTTNEMEELMLYAQIHVLYSEQKSGIKLKLLNAVSGSGAVICNENIIAGTGLEQFVHVANSPTVFMATIQSILLQKQDEENWKLRQATIESIYGQKVLEQISILL